MLRALRSAFCVLRVFVFFAQDKVTPLNTLHNHLTLWWLHNTQRKEGSKERKMKKGSHFFTLSHHKRTAKSYSGFFTKMSRRIYEKDIANVIAETSATSQLLALFAFLFSGTFFNTLLFGLL